MLSAKRRVAPTVAEGRGKGSVKQRSNRARTGAFKPGTLQPFFFGTLEELQTVSCYRSVATEQIDRSRFFQMETAVSK